MPHRRRPASPQLATQSIRIADIVVAIFADHREAGPAIMRLIDVGFGTGSLSIVGKGYPRRGPGLSPANGAAPARHAGNRTAFWSEIESTLLDANVAPAEPSTPVVALGYLARRATDFADGAAASMARLGTVLSGIGIPGEHVVRYEFAVNANGCLVMAHGDGLEIARARTVLRSAIPASIDVHAVDALSRVGPPLEADRVLSEAAAAVR